MPIPKIKKLLIANRGEIACKIIRCARKMKIHTVAIYSDEDINCLHTKLADEAINIPGSLVSETYMNSDVIIKICKKYKINAIHPGYGLLSENADFVKMVENNNLIFVGPSSKIVRNMGEKDKAKLIMEKAGVPVVPGYHGKIQDKNFLEQTAKKIGYPILIKARAGGGGRGMRVAETSNKFLFALEEATSEAKTNFKDKNCLLEKYISKARHIEIQIFGDKYGNVIHLFDRDCSLQRRQQKIIEEAPCPELNNDIRSFLGDLSVKAARSIKYEGAGTIEFIADVENGIDKNKIYFMEMNTRIQVEHPVTEAVTSTDLITWQLEIANGNKISKSQKDIILKGWSIEARLYAENVNNNFLPQSGLIHHLNFPKMLKHPNCIVETGTQEGDFITPFYDPMIAKIISFGKDRNEAIKYLENFLIDVEIGGIRTNLSLLKKLITNKNFIKGNIDTKFVESNIKDFIDNESDPYYVALAGLVVFNETIFEQQSNWYMWKPSEYPLNITIQDRIQQLKICQRNMNEYEIKVNNLKYLFTSVKIHKSSLKARLNSQNLDINYKLIIDKHTNNKFFTIFAKDITYEVIVLDSLRLRENNEEFSEDDIIAPMHGLIKFNKIRENSKVKKGDVLLNLEAMKMEYSLNSPRDGVINKIYVKNGQQVTEKMKLLSLKK
ncbi:ATP-grasp domain-containing protein [Alphaproteobacteria bacterium]|nr:ATP-grasp domain-containing protein [Alphaproteobacteria bacterium]